MITPREQIRLRRIWIKHTLGDVLVLVFVLAGVFLADPWQQYRAGMTPEFVAPENALELVFSVIAAMMIIMGIQEFNGKKVDRVRKHQRLFKRCLAGFVTGAGSRVIVG